MVVAFGALQREAEQAGADDLHRGFERVVAVGADFLGIAVALGGAGLAVAEKMGGCEQLNDFGRGGGAGRPGGEFVAGQLGADELIKWQVAIHRANHPVAIAIGERTVGVGGEVAVGIGIARGVEPVFSPAFTEADGGEVAVGGAGEGVGRVVVREGVEFCERGGRPVRVKARRRRSASSVAGGERAGEEGVEGIRAGGGGGRCGGNRRAWQWLKGPVLAGVRDGFGGGVRRRHGERVAEDCRRKHGEKKSLVTPHVLEAAGNKSCCVRCIKGRHGWK